MTDQDQHILLMQQAIGELKQVNIRIADSLNGINQNIKILNDQNVLHTGFLGEAKHDRSHIIEKLQLLTEKYWWMIIGLLVMCFMIMGYKEALTVFGG